MEQIFHKTFTPSSRLTECEKLAVHKTDVKRVCDAAQWKIDNATHDDDDDYGFGVSR